VAWWPQRGRPVGTGAGRVIVGVSGSLGSLAALHAAVAEARRTGARLVAVLAWSPAGGEVTYRRAPCPLLLERDQTAARDRLRNAFDEAFGGLPPEVTADAILVRDDPGPALVRTAHRPNDLLVVGTGTRGRFARAMHKSVARYCLARAGCPVLSIPPPALMREMHTIRRHRQLFASGPGRPETGGRPRSGE
jgi:nucleotide-binding universal stress UspA family protein